MEIVFVERHDAALALNDFKHDRGAAILKENFFNLLDIIWLNIDKSLSQRQKILVEHILPRCGEGGYRPAVEAVFQCNYIVAVRAVLLCGVFSRCLYCTFVGLRAGVREENFFHARAVAEHLRELHARLCVVEVRHVLNFARLLGYRFYPFVVGYAEGVDRYARGQIGVYLPRVVPDHGALAALDGQREPRISSGYVFLVLLL